MNIKSCFQTIYNVRKVLFKGVSKLVNRSRNTLKAHLAARIDAYNTLTVRLPIDKAQVVDAQTYFHGIVYAVCCSQIKRKSDIVRSPFKHFLIGFDVKLLRCFLLGYRRNDNISCYVGSANVQVAFCVDFVLFVEQKSHICPLGIDIDQSVQDFCPHTYGQTVVYHSGIAERV